MTAPTGTPYSPGDPNRPGNKRTIALSAALALLLAAGGVIKAKSGGTANSPPVVVDTTHVDSTPVAIDTGSYTGPMGARASAVPIAVDDPNAVGSQAAFRARVSSALGAIDPSKAGTGDPRTAFYTDGMGYADLVQFEPDCGPTGGACYVMTYLGQNLGSSTPNPELLHYLPGTGVTGIWLGRQVRYVAPFSNVGDGNSPAAIAFNATQAPGHKVGPYVGYLNANGRGGVSMSNTDIDISAGPADPAGKSYGLLDSHIASNNTQFSDNKWYDEVLYERFFRGRDGKLWVRTATWAKLTSQPDSMYARRGPALTAEVDSSSITQPDGFVHINALTWTAKNMNQSRATSEYKRVGVMVAYDASDPKHDGSADPWGLLALDSATTPLVPLAPVLVSASAGRVIVAVPLTRPYPYRESSYAARLRPVVDGVDQPAKDVTLPWEQNESWTAERANGRYVQDVRNAEVTDTLSLPAGSHSIAFRAISGNGLKITLTSPSLSVTVPSN